MKSLFNLFSRSAKELKSVRCLTVTAMLIALDLVLKMTVSIKLTESMSISFAFIAIASIGMLYGPTVAAAAGFITDILGFFINNKGGAFDIRYTLIEMLGAVLYAIVLYNASNDKWMLPRIIVSKSIVVVVCNLWLTTWALSTYYGKGFLAMFPARALKNLAQLPVDVLLLAIFLPIVLKAYNQVFKGARTVDEKLIFSDENVVKAMIVIVTILFIIICSLGIGGQFLRTENTDLKNEVKEQQTQIESMQAEIDDLYTHLGIEKAAEEPAAE